MRNRSLAVFPAVVALVASTLLAGGGSSAHAEATLSPSRPAFSYQAGPFTHAYVAALLVGCAVPEGCHTFDFALDVPRGYYERLRRSGRMGVVEITILWDNADDDFDLALVNAGGEEIATSGFGNSTFEKVVVPELANGEYSIHTTLLRVANASFRATARLTAMKPAPTAAVDAGREIAFSNGNPVTLERSSGEPNMQIAPNGDVYVDFPMGAGTNSVLFKSTDNGQAFRPMAPLHPNNNPLTNNALGGGDSSLAIDAAGRMCFSELNTLLSLGIGCSEDGGTTWTVSDPLVVDPATPLVDRQWQAATPQGEQFLSAQFGIVGAGPSKPGIRIYKEQGRTGQFVKIADVDTGLSIKSYNMAADPSDRDGNGGTIVGAYLRSNKAATAATAPHQLAIFRSTDGGATVTTHTVADLPTSPGNNFASVAVDRQGNTYVAWTEQGTWDVFYSVASKANPNRWSKPVRVNADPSARTAIQPTIKIGDRGRVFVGFYGAEQPGVPDKLPGGAWHAYLSVSTNGACMLDARPCAKPIFRQVRVTDHPVQFGGICLGGLGCGGDPYYGDRSMLEFLDVDFTPSSGQAHVVVTDSSRSSGNTTITIHHLIAGPSAYAGKPAIRGRARAVPAAAAVADAGGDAVWPYQAPEPGFTLPAADIRSVRVERPHAGTIRFVVTVADAALEAFDETNALTAASEMLVGVRFATRTDVLFAGMFISAGSDPYYAAGHLANGVLVDVYAPETEVTGRVDPTAGEIAIDVPLSALKTTLPAPEGVTRPVVPALSHATPLYAVTAFAMTSPTTADDPLVAKRLLDVAPAFTLTPKK